MADVLDLNSFRKLSQPEPPAHPILRALDALSLALADKGHEWTHREHQLYETAVSYVTSDGYTGSGS